MDRTPSATLPFAEVVAALLAEQDTVQRDALLIRYATHLDQQPFYEALKEEADRHWMIDPRVSLHLAEVMIAAGNLGEYPGGQAFGFLARGNALVYLGEYREAVAALDAAGDLFCQLDDLVGWARTRLAWIVATHRLGLGQTVFPVVEEARAILLAWREWRHLAWLDTNAAYVSHELGRIADAERLLAGAQERFAALGPDFAGQVAVVQANRGIMHTFLGNFAEALRLHQLARQTALARGEQITALRQEQNIGLVYAVQGRYTLALRHYTVAYEGFRRADLDTSAAWVTLNMLECQLGLNRSGEALALAEETIATFASHDAPAEAAKAQVLAARAHARLGDESSALACLDQAAAAFAQAGLAAQGALVAVQRGALLLDSEEWSAAQTVVATAQRIFAAQRNTLRRAEADLIQARAALALGDVPAAEALALTISRDAAEFDHAELAAGAHHLLGRVAAARGLHERALVAYGDALAEVERAQRTLALDLSSGYLGDKLAPYHDAIDTSLRLGRAHEAFSFLERAKSRVLADYLANNLQVRLRARSATDPALLAALERVRAEHNWLSQRRYGDSLSQQLAGQSDAAADAELRAAITLREREMGRILEQLALARTEGLILDGGVAVNELPRPSGLDDGTALLEYYLHGSAGYLFVWRDDRLTVVALGVGEEGLHSLLRRWHLNLDATVRARGNVALLRRLGENARSLLAAFYDALVRPAVARIAGCARLVIIPYGALHGVPFQALWDGDGHLIERAEVVTSPSCRVHELCQTRARRVGRSALALAHSQGGQLPGTLGEARLVASLLPTALYLEAEATRSSLTAHAADHDLLHLATHGVARGDNPALACLQFADGQLYTEDVCNLNLDGMLVVLSACETGKATIIGGDEPMGLSRGFLYAGAATLVQSLWFAEDTATTQIMADFYRGLQRGLAKGAALRAAQLAQLHDGQPHPFFWAPFQLLGDAGPFKLGGV